MKKFLLLACLSSLSAFLPAQESVNSNLRVNDSIKSSVRFNEETRREIVISNRGDVPLYNLELSIIDSGDFEISLERTAVDEIRAGAGSNVTVDMLVTARRLHYFTTRSEISLRISGDGFSNDFRLTLSVDPPENFWLFVILAVALLTAAALSIMFVRLNGGEENNVG